MKRIKFVGLDVHAETIAVAVAEQGRGRLGRWVIPNREESVGRLVKKVGPVEELRFCYEAGPTGYVLYWQLTALGAKCEVIAPSLVPVKAGDRVKTDRRDALKLARNYRAGELTAVWVPDAAHEALRDLVRAREAAKKDQLRARHRLSKFLLRQGRRPSVEIKRWTMQYLEWVKRGSTFRAASARSHVSRLLARGRAYGRAHCAAGWRDRRSGEVGAGQDAWSDRSAAGAARGRANIGGDHRSGSGRVFAVRSSKAVNGLRRNRTQRRLQWRAHATREYHQDRKCAFTAGGCGSCVGLPASTGCGGKVAEAARKSQRRDQRDRLESTTAVTRAVSKVAGQG